jgi:mitochondrial pyruvate carrier 1
MYAFSSSRQAALLALRESRVMARRFLSEGKETATTGAKESVVAKGDPKKPGLWNSAEFWGGLGALAGWGMSGAAIYDATKQGPEVISMTMTPVLLVYSTLFARWAWVVKPRNLLLMGCHLANIAAQSNQLRRALEHKIETGQEKEVLDLRDKTIVGGAILAGSVLAGPHVRQFLTKANLGVVSTVAAADAGPFTVRTQQINHWYSSLVLHDDGVQYLLTHFVFLQYRLLINICRSISGLPCPNG